MSLMYYSLWFLSSIQVLKYFCNRHLFAIISDVLSQVYEVTISELQLISCCVNFNFEGVWLTFEFLSRNIAEIQVCFYIYLLTGSLIFIVTQENPGRKNFVACLLSYIIIM